MKALDLLKTPLTGRHLIEASAGTGKTYTITYLYLRLLLERQLPLERILVVTYTEAATAELKERIRSGLREVPTIAVCGAAFDGVGVAACVGSAQEAAGRLLRVLAQRAESERG